MDPRMNPVGAKHIATADIETSPTHTDLIETYDATVQNERKGIAVADLLAGQVRSARVRASLAGVNGAGGVQIVAPVPGYKVRIVDVSAVAIGGNAGGGTSLDIVTTQGASAVRNMVMLVAALTQNALVKPNSANVTLTAGGALFVANDANSGVYVAKQSGGSNLTTATDFDIVVSYVLER